MPEPRRKVMISHDLTVTMQGAAGGANQNHSAKIERAQVYDPKCKACMTVKAGGNARGAHTCDRSTTGGKGYGPRKSTGD